MATREEQYVAALNAIHEEAVKILGRTKDAGYVGKKANLIVSLARYGSDVRTQQDRDE